MKVIHILKGKANHNTMNGVNLVVHSLATEQLKQGVDVEVWGISNSPKISHEHSYPMRLFPTTQTRFTIASSLKKAIDSYNHEQVIFHLHSVFLPELYGVSRRLKRNNLNWVFTPHGGYSSKSREKSKLVKIIYMSLFEKAIISGARKLHAIGYSEIDDLDNLSSNKKIVLIPNGQSFHDIKLTTSNTTNVKHPIFGFCGRLSREQKGLDILIRGFSCYKKSGGEGILWLIGDGPNTNELRKLAIESGVADSVIFHGPLFGNTKLSLINSMDVFIHNSRWEGLPTAVLEASAIGKPLLVSEATNMAYYVKKYQNGIILEDNTPNDIESALHKFSVHLKDGEANIMAKNSIKLIKEELNWTSVTKTITQKLYC